MTDIGTRIERLAGRRILVVEDDYLVGLILVDLLEDAGAKVLGPIGSVEEAITFLEDGGEAFDSAVLDVNLHGRKSYPIADALTARSVGFVFATGYGGGALEDRFQRHPRCEKPFDHGALVSALADL
jgi:CheY-like chemotaxis protein